MKEIGKERKIAIAALIVAVLMLTVAFAAMSRTLKINGTAKVDSAAWDIHFKSANMTSKKGDAREVVDPVIDNGGINLTLKVGLRKPKDEITYEAVIENLGDIDAEIESIEYPSLTDDQSKIIEFEATYQNGDEISKSQELKAKDEKTVKIVIRYKDITDESLLAKEAYDIPLTFKINYVQKGFATQDTPEGGGTVDIESSPYKVTPDGTLYHYVRQGNETSITVPAEVDGIKIKKIGGYVFLDADFMVVNDWSAVIIINGDYEAQIREFANEENILDIVKLDEFSNEIVPFVIELVDEKYSFTETEEIINSPDAESANYLVNVDLSNMLYLEEIGDNAFGAYEGSGQEECGHDGYCSLGTLEEVIFPENGVLTTIGDSAFIHNKLTSINIPNSVTTILYDAFCSNQFLNLTIPTNVRTLKKGAFKYNNLTTVTVLGEPQDRFDSDWVRIFGEGVIRQ